MQRKTKKTVDMKFQLRDYQQKSVDAIRGAYQKGYRTPLLVLPTGGGKTIVFSHIAERMAARGKRVYTLVHRKELLMQASGKLNEMGLPQHGLIAPGHSMTGDLVQVASVQTLARRLDRLPEPDLIIIDEAHHAAAGTWKKILDRWPHSRFLGVTATPIRLDGKPLGKKAGGYFDTLVEGPNIRWMIDNGYLTQPVVYGPPTGIDPDQLKMRGKDFSQESAEALYDRPTITGNAIEHYLRICNGLPTIAFCTSVAHAEHAAAQFTAAGISAYSLTADLTDAQRKHRIDCLADGRVSVLTSCDIVSEGTDIPVVAVAMLLRPTQSLGLYLQQVGRVLRPYPGKKQSIILDHAGNSLLRHGMPDEVRDWDLDAGVIKRGGNGEKGPATRRCERCYAVFPGGARQCPACGYVAPVKERSILEVAGELIQMTPEQIAAFRKRSRAAVGRARTLDELLQVAEMRGYKKEWAYQIYNRRQMKGRAA